MTVGAVIVPADLAEALADATGRLAVRRIVDAAWAGGALPIIVVAPDPDARLAAALAGSPAHRLEPPPGGGAPAYDAGTAAALDAVGETTAVLLWPGRMTWVDPETVTSLIEAHGRVPGAITRPDRAGAAGWPVLVPVTRIQELGLGGEQDVEAALARRDDVTRLELGDPGTVLGRETPLVELPAYDGPPEPVGGPPPEWGAAAAEAPEPEVRR